MAMLNNQQVYIYNIVMGNFCHGLVTIHWRLHFPRRVAKRCRAVQVKGNDAPGVAPCDRPEASGDFR